MDYVIILSSLLLTSAYGLYYGIQRKKMFNSATFEYLLASRNMGVIPIAFSYFASLTSSGVIIGHPAEVYSFGMQIVLLGVTVLPCIYVFNEVFMPIYHRLSSGSVYEYLEKRFNIGIKNLVTGLVVFQTVVLSSANVYGPSTVLSQVTGLSTWLIVVVLSIVCIVYTTLGGIRAVILADVVQAMLMLLSMVLLLVFGLFYIGDLDLFYTRNFDTGRLNVFHMDLNMNVRQTFWNTTVGYFFSFMALTTTSQFLVQRFMTAPTIAIAKRANIVGNLLFILGLVLVQCLGLVMYATFHGCDPLKSGLIQNMDQLLPAYLMKVLSSYLALPGIIFTGILCACLSTLSSVYNSTATIIMVSFVKPRYPNMSDGKAAFTCKWLVLVVGVLSTVGVAVAELFPNVLQSVLSIFSAVSAPLFGMLLVGIFCPQANVKAISISFVSSVCLILYAIAGTLLVKPKLVTLSLTTDSCVPFNITTAANDTSLDFEYALASSSAPKMIEDSSFWSTYFPLSSMSYLWYSAVGTMSTLILFVLLSLFLSKETSKDVDLDMIPAVVQKLHQSLPRRFRRIFLCDVYNSTELQKTLKGESTTEEDRV